MLAIKAPENYHHEAGLISRVGDYVAPLAQRVAIITSPTAWEATQSAITASLEKYALQVEIWFLTGPCHLAVLKQFADEIASSRAELILGIGGGRVMDAAKAVGALLDNLAVINVPTIAATCAAWSPSTVLYDEHGGHNGYLLHQRYPVWVLVDSTVIAQAPVRYLRAGIVDALAKWFEFSPFQRNGETVLGLTLKVQAAKLAHDVITEYGEQAVADNQRQLTSDALRQVIDANIALAGMANSIIDEDPRAGMAHLIHDVLTHYPPTHQWLHGEIVGLGLVIQHQLDEGTGVPLPTYLATFHAPVTLRQLGLTLGSNGIDVLTQHILDAIDEAARLPFNVTHGEISQVLKACNELFPAA